MGTTPTYSWPYPESSDFVADGATAIENLADAVDTTVAGFGTWTTYTPTLVNITLGSGGTVTAAYARVNKFYAVRLVIGLGSGGSFTGTATVTTPANMASNMNAIAIGQVRMLDTGSAFYLGWVTASGTNTVQFQAGTAGGTFVGQAAVNTTTPFTWTNTDVLWSYFTFEAA
jgi:hypothetical protein